MEDRSRIRRLANLGIYGHQPGIAALVDPGAEEDQTIVESLLRQKVGCNPKTMKHYTEHVERRQDDPDTKMRIRIARLATRTVIRWKRVRKPDADEEDLEDEERQDDAPTYGSRILRCARCEAPQETRWMQLGTSVGYRAIHCKDCKKQETCAKNKCQCNLIWHRCLVHRVDPLTHSFKKGRKGVKKETAKEPKKKKEEVNSSERKAPHIAETKQNKQAIFKKGREDKEDKT